MALYKLSHHFLGDSRHLLHGNKTSTAVTVFNRDQHWRLTCSTAPTLATTPATDKRIINLYQIMQAINAIAMSHCNTDLAQHPTGSDPGYANLPGKPHS